MRELYQQFVAYSNQFVATIPDYRSEDRQLAFTTDAIVTATANICSSIDYESAPAIAPLVVTPSTPTTIAPLGDPADPAIFIEQDNPACQKWSDMVNRFGDETADWVAIDPAIPAAEWTPEQRDINEKAARAMVANADEVEKLGRESGNPTLEDIATLGAQYRRGSRRQSRITMPTTISSPRRPPTWCESSIAVARRCNDWSGKRREAVRTLCRRNDR